MSGDIGFFDGIESLAEMGSFDGMGSLALLVASKELLNCCIISPIALGE